MSAFDNFVSHGRYFMFRLGRKVNVNFYSSRATWPRTLQDHTESAYCPNGTLAFDKVF
jgi:hypothetical protein